MSATRHTAIKFCFLLNLISYFKMSCCRHFRNQLPAILAEKMRRYILIFLIALSGKCLAQDTLLKNDQFAFIGGGFGESQFSLSSGYIYNWHLGTKKKFFIGTGGRLTNYFGKDKAFLSAPAKLANETESTDTILASKPGVNAINLLINLGYNFNSRFQAGFNIDLIGLSFGSNANVSAQNINTTAKPTAFNLLLVGNNDLGTLNSQFYLQYRLQNKLGIYTAFQYLFTELKTKVPVQVLPEQNDRFRNKASMFYAGLTYHF